MFAFFHGWRRKIGVFTLVTACVFAAAWVRSLTVSDMLAAPFGLHLIVGVISVPHLLSLGIETDPKTDLGWEFAIWDSSTEISNPADDSRLNWRWRLSAFAIAGYHDDDPDVPQVLVCTVPYWSIVLPLTLLSGWLLLSKPRGKKPASAST